MKRYKIHEFAKILSGLVLADFIVWWWLAASHMLPVTFFGIMATQSMVAPGMIFDAAVFIILVHYGWYLGKTPSINKRSYFTFVGVILGIIAFFHLLRLFTGAPVTIVGWQVPLWMSWVGTIIAAYLSYMSFHLRTKE